MASQFLLLLLPALCWGQWTMPDMDQAAGYTMVHLFEWTWADIAQECESFLSEKGYGGVQVSPPQECIAKISEDRPWWERYQPCSYILESRSGSEAEFQDMVQRCHAVGVWIYADIVINQMTSNHSEVDSGCTGSSTYDYYAYSYPAVPYNQSDFNTYGCSMNYSVAWSVRNCQLLGMRDLTQADPHVQNMTAEYMNRLTSYGVAGFRIDAAKHMYPNELDDIYAMLDDLNATYFSAGLRPYIYQEVIEAGSEPITAAEYTPYARVTEFKYCRDIGRSFKGYSELQYLYNFGEAWGFMDSGDALVFVDNHDNQRGESEGPIITHQDPWRYKMVNGFHLAWDYGDRRIMSSYYFTEFDEGPPSDVDGNIIGPTFNTDGSCNGGWTCEHRWRQIYNMVIFRNDVIGTSPQNWWDNGGNQISFSRGNRGFVAFNNDDHNLSATLQTGLPAGTYCDVISGDLSSDGLSCTGGTITVNSDGTASIFVAYQPNTGALDPDGFVAIHVSKML